MIPCSELRIGNYILAQARLVQIISVCGKSSLHNKPYIEVHDPTTNIYLSHFIDSIQPVPMSDAVLRQCGFLYHDYFKFWQLLIGTGPQRSEMDIDRDYTILDFMRKPIVKEVASLHQLQNIYFMLHGREIGFRPGAAAAA